MENCMESWPNIIDGWDFSIPVRQRYDYSTEGYSVDRWRWPWVPEIIHRWREWKRLRDEWAEFLRTQSFPLRKPLCRLLKHIPNFP